MWDQVHISQAIYRWAKILHMCASDRTVNHFQHFPKFNAINVHDIICWAFFSVHNGSQTAAKFQFRQRASSDAHKVHHC